MSEFHVVTGAFGYTGKYIARRLISMGKKVKTITGRPGKLNPFGEKLIVEPFNFDNPSRLVKSLEGATTLYNTYWVRFSYGQITFDRAVENTKILVNAAKEAGVKRFVHVSITNPSHDSKLPYFKGKALLEDFIRNSGISYAIIRPAVIFGAEDILINNIAWLIRRFPVFAIPGKGDYKLQPVYIDDMVDIAVEAAGKDEDMIIDAVGPETYSFKELLHLISEKLDRKVLFINMFPSLALFLSQMLSYLVNDVLLTSDELKGLMADLLISDKPPTGHTKLSEWIEKNHKIVGLMYASELNKHYKTKGWI